ncbi:Ldh family oxidoreductase [Castellaniella sp. GW247-6E4]|uniref:Ldh family oxidoreductase n=1 Tax=Castellaniella sp. GW247-6E4 TaxID=3140380 RepID=UPI003315ED4A
MKPIPFDLARSVALEALARANVPPAHALLQADLLLEAELRGRPSHGLLRLPRVIERIANGVTDPSATGRHAWAGNFLRVEGGGGLGPVIAVRALDVLMDKVAGGGVAVAAIRGNNHLGMLAWYAERVARRDMVLIGLCNSEALVHPWAGRRAMLGTNPVTVGVPTTAGPFVMDMATSLVSMGRIHDHANQNQPIPQGWALDADGNPTTDPHAARLGSIAPFGGPKGYALGLAFEVLIGALTDCALGPEVRGTLDSTEPCNKGDVFIVIDPHSTQGTGRALADYLEAVRLSGAPGAGVAVPGDRAAASRTEKMRDGLPVATGIWRRLLELAGRDDHGA